MIKKVLTLKYKIKFLYRVELGQETIKSKNKVAALIVNYEFLTDWLHLFFCFLVIITCTLNKGLIVILWAVRAVNVGKTLLSLQPLHKSGLNIYIGPGG